MNMNLNAFGYAGDVIYYTRLKLFVKLNYGNIKNFHLIKKYSLPKQSSVIPCYLI